MRIPEPALIVLVGAAGAGKSTLAGRQFPAEAVLSSDAMRQAVSGNAADQGATKVAFRILHRELERRLAAGKLVVVDATNAETHARRALTRRAAQAGAPAIAIVLDLPPTLVHARAAKRTSRAVDAGVVDRHLQAIRHAVDGGRLADDGFRTIVVLRSADEVEAFSAATSS